MLNFAHIQQRHYSLTLYEGGQNLSLRSMDEFTNSLSDYPLTLKAFTINVYRNFA